MPESSESVDLTGKKVLVTGGNSGIGKETVVALARMGARVAFTARDMTKGADAREEIARRARSDEVEVLPLDLSSLDTVRSFAERVNAAVDRIDVLVNNAGLVLRTRQVSADGYEMTFAVNHLGPFLLTNLLRDKLVAGAPSRVVNVASDAHKSVRRGLDFDDLQSTRRYRPFAVYARTKLANILFTRELARRLEGTGVTANAVHPGFVASNFAREGDTGRLGDIGMRLLRPLARTPEAGARTTVYVASAPELATVTGRYFANSRLATPTAAAQDDDAARRLWEISEQLAAR